MKIRIIGDKHEIDKAIKFFHFASWQSGTHVFQGQIKKQSKLYDSKKSAPNKIVYLNVDIG